MAKYITGLTTEEWDMIFSGDPTPLMDETKSIDLEDISGATIFSHPFLKSDKIKTLTERNSNGYSVGVNFLKNSTLENLYLENLKDIGDYFLYGCTSLTSLSLPSLTNISYSINIPNCTSLAEIHLPNLTMVNDNGLHFNGGTSLTEISLPNLTTVSYFSLSGCTSLTEVNLPVLSTSVYLNFSGCTSLTEIHLPYVTTVRNTIDFSNCTSLTKINLPMVVGPITFSGCTSLTSISADNFPALETLADSAFTGTSVQEFYAPPLLLSIPYGCFKNVITLTTVNLNNVTDLGTACFGGCSGLTTVNAPKLKTITVSPFDNCENLKNVSMPELETIVANGVFQRCDLSGEIDFSSLKTVASNTFNKCKFSEITLPEAEVFNGANVFAYCDQLEKVVLPKITNLGTNPFGLSDNLREVYLLAPQMAIYDNNNSLGIPPDCKIFVPENLVDEYKASSIWSSYSDKIFAYEGEL